ncbi:MAG: hypothetical protein JWM68_365 [Verrucomicrobiales bacterium]|nr:hypothetical protein [Verrucomicrobiales bacterium]
MNKVFLVGSTLLLSSIFSYAQPTPVQQVESTVKIQEQQRRMMTLESGTLAPELYPGENDDVGPQHILKLKPRHEWFNAIVDSQFLYTSNTRLANNSEGSTLWVNAVEAAIAPKTFSLLKRDIATRAGFRLQWYNYDLDQSPSVLSIFDFHAQTAFIEQSFAPADNWLATYGLEATRLLQQPSYDEIYKEFAPNWGLSRSFPISKDKLFMISYKGYYRLSETTPALVLPFLTTVGNVNDRTDHTVIFSYSQEIFPKLIVQPFYRFQYTHFTTVSSRNDYLNTAGIFLSYNVCKNASVRTFVTYERRDTDNVTLASEYDKFDTGLGVTLNLKF